MQALELQDLCRALNLSSRSRRGIWMKVSLCLHKSLVNPAGISKKALVAFCRERACSTRVFCGFSSAAQISFHGPKTCILRLSGDFKLPRVNVEVNGVWMCPVMDCIAGFHTVCCRNALIDLCSTVKVQSRYDNGWQDGWIVFKKTLRHFYHLDKICNNKLAAK